MAINIDDILKPIETVDEETPAEVKDVAESEDVVAEAGTGSDVETEGLESQTTDEKIDDEVHDSDSEIQSDTESEISDEGREDESTVDDVLEDETDEVDESTDPAPKVSETIEYITPIVINLPYSITLCRAPKLETRLCSVSGKIHCTGELIAGFEKINCIIRGRGVVEGYVESRFTRGSNK